MQFEKFNKSIIERIDTLRQEQGLSWGKLAYASGVAKGALSDIKNGLSEARFSTLCKLAIGLNMHPKELFDFDIDLSELDV
jgi:transcriptional regulator with XRE-family HTH domain